MAIPAALAAAVTSSSFVLPRLNNLAATPACASNSSPSGMGRKASDAATAPVRRPLHRQLGRLDSRHLARSDTDRHSVLDDNDGVRLDMAADRPGNQKIVPLLFIFRCDEAIKFSERSRIGTNNCACG